MGGVELGQIRNGDLDQLVTLGAVVEEKDLLSDSVAPELGDGVDPEIVIHSAADETVGFS